MRITITVHCPDCQSINIKKNGKKNYGKQNYLCKNCSRQFIGDHAMSYKGCHWSLTQKILLMPVRGIDIRDISVIENVSVKKVLSVPVNSNRIITPSQQHDDSLELEVDEFWTYVGSKKRKVGLFTLIIAAQAKLLHMFGENAILKQPIICETKVINEYQV